jgi:hypothetical protein
MSASLVIDLTLQQASAFHGEIFNTNIKLYVLIAVYNIIIVDSKVVNPDITKQVCFVLGYHSPNQHRKGNSVSKECWPASHF